MLYTKNTNVRPVDQSKRAEDHSSSVLIMDISVSTDTMKILADALGSKLKLQNNISKTIDWPEVCLSSMFRIRAQGLEARLKASKVFPKCS